MSHSKKNNKSANKCLLLKQLLFANRLSGGFSCSSFSFSSSRLAEKSPAQTRGDFIRKVKGPLINSVVMKAELGIVVEMQSNAPSMLVMGSSDHFTDSDL